MLPVVACLAVAGLAAWWILTRGGGPPPPPAPAPAVAAEEAWPVAALPRHLARTGRADVPVRVAFPFDLVPTADPLVWLYVPAVPPGGTPPAYRVTFPSPPRFGPRPHAVRGTASLVGDGRRRTSGVSGVVDLRAAPPDRP